MLVVTGWSIPTNMEYFFAYMSLIITIKNQQFHTGHFLPDITWIGLFSGDVSWFYGLSWDVPWAFSGRPDPSHLADFLPGTLDIKISQGQPPVTYVSPYETHGRTSPGSSAEFFPGFRTNHQQISVDPISCRLVGSWMSRWKLVKG